MSKNTDDIGPDSAAGSAESGHGPVSEPVSGPVNDSRNETPHNPGNGPQSGADLARAALAAARTRSGRNAATGRRQRGGIRATADAGDGARRLKRRRWSGPGDDRARDPQPVGETLRSWLRTTGAGAEITKAELFARWAEIVGDGIADHAEPVSLVDGELTVRAESTAWATQLRLMSRGLIARINKELGPHTVRQIKTAGPAAPSWRFGKRHISGRGPRDTYG